ncbi:hypothetical protein Nmel_003393, partial [Mimus melanotis]
MSKFLPLTESRWHSAQCLPTDNSVFSFVHAYYLA